MLSLFKPKWQHQNPDVRIRAIQSSALDEEILLKLIRNDPECSVKKVAIQNISSLSTLYTIFLQEQNESLKEDVLAQIARMVETSDDTRNTMLHFLSDTVRRDFSYAGLILKLQDRDLKQLVFSKITKKEELELLIERGFSFTKAQIETMQDESILRRLLKHSDQLEKRSIKEIKERLSTIEEKNKKSLLKISLLTDYEQLSNTEILPALNKFSDLEKAWKQNGFGNENKVFKERYLSRYQEENERRSKQEAKLTEIKDRLNSGMISTEELKVLEKTLDDFIENTETISSFKEEANTLKILLTNRKNEFKQNQKIESNISGLMKEVESILTTPYIIAQKQLNQLKERINALPESEKSTRVQLNHKITERIEKQKNVAFDKTTFLNQLEKLKELIKEGALQKAQEIFHELNNMLKNGISLTKQDYSELRKLLQHESKLLFDKLDLVRWSGNRALESLVDEAENLLGQLEEKSTDYTSHALKTFRDNWNEAIKTSGKAPFSLKKRFESTCQAIYEHIRSKRDAENDLRQIYINEAESLLSQLEEYVQTINWESPDWKQIQEMRARFLKEWNRYLSQYSNGERLEYGQPLFLKRDKRHLENKMNQILKPVDNAISDERKREHERRVSLIKRLESFNLESDLSEAITFAKKANYEFSPTVRSSYKEENRLWKQMRAVCDKIFGLRQEHFATLTQEKTENLSLKEQILARLQHYVDSIPEETTMAMLEDVLLKYQREWDDIGAVPNEKFSEIEKEFKQIFSHTRNTLRKREILRKEERRNQLLSHSIVLGQLEQVVIDGGEVSEIPSFDELAQPLEQRLNCLKKVKEGHDDAVHYLVNLAKDSLVKARQIVLLREILLSRPVQEEDRQEKMKLQLSILEKGNHKEFQSQFLEKKLADLDREWFENVVGAVPDRLLSRFKE